jgi:hypothetical protein
VHLNACRRKGRQVGGGAAATDGKGLEIVEVGGSGFWKERNLGLCCVASQGIMIMKERRENVIDIETIREYFKSDTIVITQHAKNRCRERSIKQKDIKNCIMTGEIIEQYPEDFPFPSYLIFGRAADNRIIHVVVSDEGESGRIITAYIPNTSKFEDDLKTRKELG